jgi:hypothetical protein
MKIQKASGVFSPHESARAESLAGVSLAPFGRRFAAFYFDLFFVVITYAPVEAGRQLLIAALQHKEKVNINFAFDFHEPGNVVWMILYYGIFVWKTNGLTPGKRLMRIRVVSLTHTRITLWQSIERAMGYGASMLEGGFGFLQFFLYPNHTCVHDRIAETIVVRDPRPVKQEAD